MMGEWVGGGSTTRALYSWVQELAPVNPLAVFAVVKGFGVEFARACEAELEVGRLTHLDPRRSQSNAYHLTREKPVARVSLDP